MTEKLWEGESLFTRLSNEDELVRMCKGTEFRRDWVNNKWCELAGKVFFNGADTKDWPWKSDDVEVRANQHRCLHLTLSSFGQQHEDKMAVAGWMLSEMLTEIPK